MNWPARGRVQRALSSLLLLVLTSACASAATPAPTPTSDNPPPVAVVAAPIAPAAQAGATPPSLGELRFSYVARSITMLPMFIVSELGFDKEEGFTANRMFVQSSVAVKGMLAGEFEFSESAGSTLTAGVQGAPMRVVIVHVAKPLWSLYAKPEITTVQGLKDRTIGLDTIGGAQELAIRLILQRNGLDHSSVTMVGVGGGGTVPSALVAGALDAGVVSIPNDIKLGLKEPGKVTHLAFLGDFVPVLSSGLGTTEKLLEERPEAVRAAVRAAQKAQRFLIQNRQGAIPLLMDFLELTEAQANEAYDATIPHFTQDGRITLELQQQILRDQVAELKPDREPRAEDLFDLRYVEDSPS